ncbi:CRP/FNR family transcriptional regulator, anaerobic regulatory protein [Propionibacterium cyclohexanicum]|mgnify:CR=1 FL=1|uniref:CRP/FNR family transcriptional regulator, anaerobic regulatory protein n=1 Tax=Propionibacterium cyclohexanicum TaxID=64702 RepID=A0A1H9R7J2_9ACTN|nr:Crp/Fnr family transcriptional regulator [Propionibacterium cyclohexanicum]SER68505.1 CRP/FNR family transcriptional regulator, anaerobic regulatory protein [Propionibacterium cyclohexanicum]
MRQSSPREEHHDSCVSQVPIFRGLTVEQQQVVASLAGPATLPGGALLHDMGHPLGELFAIHSGRIQVVHIAPSGRHQLLHLAGPGEVIGEHAFLTGQRPEYIAETTERTVVCVFRHADLVQLIGDYPSIAMGLLRSVSDQLVDAQRRLTLGATDVTTRLANYLLDLPATDPAHPERVHLPMAKKDVASWLVTTPESLSRALAHLAHMATIRVQGSTIDLLDPERLEELAAS